MATQSVRNIMNNSIARILPEVKKRVREEGQKKLEELQQELLTPETIVKILQPEINKDTCSERGKEKFQEKVDKLEKKIERIEEQVNKGIGSLQILSDKIGPITSTAELPPGIPSPINTINSLTEVLQPLTNALQIIIQAAPLILASQVSVAGVGAVSGTVITNTTNNVNNAKSLVKELVSLFRTIPRQLKHYQRIGDGIYKNITFLKDKLQEILDKIGLLKSYLIYLEMDFLNKCGQLEDPSPPIDLTTGGTIPPQMTMEDIIAQTEALYGDMLNSLIAQGDQKAIERTFVLNTKFERIKNIRIRTINI